jgi:hypothetical protein
MAQTVTQSGLAAMAGQMPVRNQELADQQRAARTLQLQQAISKLTPQQAPTAQQAAGMGAALAAQAGQEQVNRAQQMLETTGQMARLGQQETALAGQQKLGAMQEAARQEQLSQIDRLAKLDANAKRELFDKELTFRKDAANQTFFTERQLADYKKQSAVSDEQYRNYANQAQNYHKRNIASLEAVYNKLAEIEKNNFQIGEQKLDQAARKEIQTLLADAKRRVADAQRRAANNTQMWSTGLGIAGGIAGAFTGTPQGAMIGYQAGSALGGTIGSQQETEV